MIVVKVELWPKGFEGRKREIGRMTITNDGTSTERKRGNYDIKVMRRGTQTTVQRTGRLENYAREAYCIWMLVGRAIKAAFDKETSHE